MRKQQKQINYLLLFSLVSILILPNFVFAHDGAGKGKLQIKTDRIFKQDDSEEDFELTEMDKVFPDLFTEEVKEHLDEQQSITQEETKELKEKIFYEDIPEKTALYDVKSELFTEEYTSTFVNKSKTKEEQDSGISNVVFYGTFVAVIGFISSGVFMLIRNF